MAIQKTKDKGMTLKWMLIMLGINSAFMYLYRQIRYLLAQNGLILRVWTFNIYYFVYAVNIVLLILIVMYLLSCIMGKSIAHRIFGGIACIITLLLGYFMYFFIMWGYAIDYDHEYEVFEHNRNLIASVGDYGMHHTIITYYEPINFIIMKTTDIENEIYDGCFDDYYILKE